MFIASVSAVFTAKFILSVLAHSYPCICFNLFVFVFAVLVWMKRLNQTKFSSMFVPYYCRICLYRLVCSRTSWIEHDNFLHFALLCASTGTFPDPLLFLYPSQLCFFSWFGPPATNFSAWRLMWLLLFLIKCAIRSNACCIACLWPLQPPWATWLRLRWLMSKNHLKICFDHANSCLIFLDDELTFWVMHRSGTYREVDFQFQELWNPRITKNFKELPLPQHVLTTRSLIFQPVPSL